MAPRLAIFGATGGTGRHMVEQGLRQGHTLVALARNPARLAINHERLRIVQGDVLDPAAVGTVIDGCHGVFVCLAPTSGDHHTFYSNATDNVTNAMDAAGVRRIVVVSAAPLAPDQRNDTAPYRLVIKPLLLRALRKTYGAMAVMEQQLRDSNLEWTLLRPPRLTDKPARGRYRTTVGGTVRRGYSLSRADLAHAALQAFTDRSTVGTAVGLGY